MGYPERVLIAFVVLLIPSTSFACKCSFSAADEERAFQQYEQVATITVIKAELLPHGGVVGWGEVFLNLKGNSFKKVRLESPQPFTDCSYSSIEVGGRYVAFIEPDGLVTLRVCGPSQKQEYIQSKMIREKIDAALSDYVLKWEALQEMQNNSRNDNK